jgi:hypothetical protein
MSQFIHVLPGENYESQDLARSQNFFLLSPLVGLHKDLRKMFYQRKLYCDSTFDFGRVMWMYTFRIRP